MKLLIHNFAIPFCCSYQQNQGTRGNDQYDGYDTQNGGYDTQGYDQDQYNQGYGSQYDRSGYDDSTYNTHGYGGQGYHQSQDNYNQGGYDDDEFDDQDQDYNRGYQRASMIWRWKPWRWWRLITVRAIAPVRELLGSRSKAGGSSGSLYNVGIGNCRLHKQLFYIIY